MPYMIPYNSSYWELSGKLGLNRKINNTTIDWSAYGAGILPADSENKYNLSGNISGLDVDFGSFSIDDPSGAFDSMKGDVSGYRFGSDLWIQHHVDECLTLPFLVSVGYTKKHRDGDGPAYLYGFFIPTIPDNDPHVNINYNDVVRTLDIKVGGGVVHEIKDCRKLGAGLYYNYHSVPRSA